MGIALVCSNVGKFFGFVKESAPIVENLSKLGRFTKATSEILRSGGEKIVQASDFVFNSGTKSVLAVQKTFKDFSGYYNAVETAKKFQEANEALNNQPIGTATKQGLKNLGGLGFTAAGIYRWGKDGKDFYDWVKGIKQADTCEIVKSEHINSENFEKQIQENISQALKLLDHCAENDIPECVDFGRNAYEKIHEIDAIKADLIALKCLSSDTQQCKSIGFRSFMLALERDPILAYHYARNCLEQKTSQCIEILSNGVKLLDASYQTSLIEQCAKLNTVACKAISAK